MAIAAEAAATAAYNAVVAENGAISSEIELSGTGDVDLGDSWSAPTDIVSN
jgi:hypothetical protein